MNWNLQQSSQYQARECWRGFLEHPQSVQNANYEGKDSDLILPGEFFDTFSSILFELLRKCNWISSLWTRLPTTDSRWTSAIWRRIMSIWTLQFQVDFKKNVFWRKNNWLNDTGLLEIPSYGLAVVILLYGGRRIPYFGCVWTSGQLWRQLAHETRIMKQMKTLLNWFSRSMLLCGISLLSISLVPEGQPTLVLVIALFGELWSPYSEGFQKVWFSTKNSFQERCASHFLLVWSSCTVLSSFQQKSELRGLVRPLLSAGFLLVSPCLKNPGFS